jgi:acyl carrier protein
LPLTPNGKVDKRALLGLESLAFGVKENIDEPRNEVEETLIQIWKQVLGVDQIGITNNFFELGGHSLNAIQVISRIHEHFNIVLSPRAIFEEPTISELAIMIIQALIMQIDDKEIYKLLAEFGDVPDETLT